MVSISRPWKTCERCVHLFILLVNPRRERFRSCARQEVEKGPLLGILFVRIQRKESHTCGCLGLMNVENSLVFWRGTLTHMFFSPAAPPLPLSLPLSLFSLAPFGLVSALHFSASPSLTQLFSQIGNQSEKRRLLLMRKIDMAEEIDRHESWLVPLGTGSSSTAYAWSNAQPNDPV